MTTTENKRMKPFRVGDKVRHIAGLDKPTYTVQWVSKGNSANRDEQTIATEFHDRWNSTEWAYMYVEAN